MGKHMYCICYNDNGDKKILINYGLFDYEGDCIQKIEDLGVKNLETYRIKVNPKQSITSYEEGYIIRLENTIRHLLLKEIQRVKSEHVFSSVKELRNYIEYYTYGFIYGLNPDEFGFIMDELLENMNL